MMAASLPLYKFIEPPNSHLLCGVCHAVFVEPVINVSCGHSFCSGCAKSALSCPLDSSAIEVQKTVVNRALQSQIDDLEVKCPHSLLWNEELHDYDIIDESCSAVIRLGDLLEHQKACEFRLEPCPYRPSVCGRIRFKDLMQHQCPFRFGDDDIDGLGSASRQQVSMSDVLQIVNQVNTLENRIQALEKENSELKKQAIAADGVMKQMQRRISELEDTCKRSVRTSSFRAVTGNASRSDSWVMPFQFKCIGTLRGHRKAVKCLAQHRSYLFSAGVDQCVKVWNIEDLARGCERTLTCKENSIQCMTADQTNLYCASDNLAIILWSLKDLEMVKTVENAHENAIEAMVTANGKLFSSSLTLIKVWDCVTMQVVHTISGLHHWVRSLAYNLQTDKLYSGSHNTIEAWNASRFNLVGRVTHTYGSVHSLLVNNKYIIAGTYNNNTHLYDVNSLKHVFCLNGHLACVHHFAASPLGRFLFSASADSTVQVWNLDNLLPIQTLSRHESSVNAVILHSDLLFSASDDAEIKVFRHFKMDTGLP